MNGSIGEVRLFSANFEPQNWAFCHGQELEISEYTDLYNLIGTIYGGDGRNTFALPNVQSRVVCGAGNTTGLSSTPLGIMTGQENVVLTQSETPNHSHDVSFTSSANMTPRVLNDTGVSDEPDGHYFAIDSGGDKVYSSITNGKMGSTTATLDADVNVQNAGNAQGHSNIQPITVLHFIICTNGTSPTRP